MPRKEFSFSKRIAHLVLAVTAAPLVVLTCTGMSFASRPSEHVIYSFLGSSDASDPRANLIADASGNLYGTGVRGGTDGVGAIFELTPPTAEGNAWTEAILHNFQFGTGDGNGPYGTLTFDKQGNLYGTTQTGGAGDQGTIFELSPPAITGGAWNETILWSFPPHKERGSWPMGTLVMDEDNNLYGTTVFGGTHNMGTVFELVAPKTQGAPWEERVLYSFGASETDGVSPNPELLLRGGILYGTTVVGGTGAGTVFQLTRQPGLWAETILFAFPKDGKEGYEPFSGVIADSAGNLYGDTAEGGGNCPTPAKQCGVVYELSPPAAAGDPWQETILYKFTGHGDGAGPFGLLWRNKLGDIYGTAIQGGLKDTDNSNVGTLGTVFKLKHPATAGSPWTLAVVHDFGGSPQTWWPDGGQWSALRNGPRGPVTGSTVFSITP